MGGVADVGPERRPVLGCATSRSAGEGSNELKTGWSHKSARGLPSIGAMTKPAPPDAASTPTPMPMTPITAMMNKAMGWRMRRIVYPRGWNEPRKFSVFSVRTMTQPQNMQPVAPQRVSICASLLLHRRG